MNERWKFFYTRNSTPFYRLQAPLHEHDLIKNVMAIALPDVVVYEANKIRPYTTASHGLSQEDCLMIDNIMETIK
jgi:hypothetical protein